MTGMTENKPRLFARQGTGGDGKNCFLSRVLPIPLHLLPEQTFVNGCLGGNRDHYQADKAKKTHIIFYFGRMTHLDNGDKDPDQVHIKHGPFRQVVIPAQKVGHPAGLPAQEQPCTDPEQQGQGQQGKDKTGQDNDQPHKVLALVKHAQCTGKKRTAGICAQYVKGQERIKVGRQVEQQAGGSQGQGFLH